MAAVHSTNGFEAAQALEAGTPQQHAPQPGASLTFKDLSFTAKLPSGEAKTILEPCSGHLEAGQLVAVMGPSGSGKTTLLDMLAMKKTAPYAGEVFVNGHARDGALFQRISAYVPQEDRMPAHWKVREAVAFSAALKRRPGTSRAETEVLVDKLLDVTGLRQVADTCIGGDAVRGISGGQRRRVSLARGVAAGGSLLFCDEPTSGLSATDAELCMQTLRQLTRDMGVLALVVIHQPRREVADLFDTLVLLTSNPGRLTYLGPMAGAPMHFAACGFPVPDHATPTDFFLDLVTPGAKADASVALVAAFDGGRRPEVEALVAQALAAPGPTAAELVQASGPADSQVRLGPYAAPFREQFRHLVGRQAKLTVRNPGMLVTAVVGNVGMGLVLGSIFSGVGRQAFGMADIQFVFIIMAMLSLQSLPTMPLLIEERMYMKHETSERLYHESAYILASLCVGIPLSLVPATCQLAIILAMSGLPGDVVAVLLLWCLLLVCFFDAMFQCIAAAARDAEQAQLIATPPVALFMLFNGIVVTKTTAPIYLRWIFQISPTAYALQAVVLRMAEDAGSMGLALVDNLGFHENEKETMKGAIIIVCMACVLRVLQAIFLQCLNKIQR